MKLAAGVLVVITMGAPPLRGVAMKVYCVKVTPGGARAVAYAVVLLVSAALVRAGAPTGGIVMGTMLEKGVDSPSIVAQAVTL